jgi:hypothetical protein
MVDGRTPSDARTVFGGLAAGGVLLSATFVLAVSFAGDPAFLWNLLVVGPVFAVAAAGSAAGSLALARRAQDRERLETTDDGTAVDTQVMSRAAH